MLGGRQARVKESVGKCYDEGTCPDEVDLGEVVEDGEGKRFVVYEAVDGIKEQWLKERTVIIIFQDEARGLSRQVKLDLVRAYEDGWFARKLFNLDIKRGRVRFEGPNVILYVAKAGEVATWLIEQGEAILELQDKEYRATFKPWMTRQDLKKLRLQEAERNFWIVALRVQLDAYYYLRSAVTKMSGEVLNMHPPKFDSTRPKLMNVKLDMSPDARFRVDDELVIESSKGERWKVEVATPYTDWCRRYYFLQSGVPYLVQVLHEAVQETARDRCPHPEQLLTQLINITVKRSPPASNCKRPPTSLMNRLNIATWNLRGLGDTTGREKKRRVKSWVHEWKVNCLLIQESKLNEAKLAELGNWWEGSQVWAPTQGTRGGVGILLHQDLQARVLESEADLWERWAWFRVEVGNEEWSIMTVYAPTDKRERVSFFANLMLHIPKVERLIITGDWNLTLDEVLQPNARSAN
ncbi:hypothetical protein CBR_g20086 [Chara braunii]|uniref:Endonuclease/exonuclease/phosphatase domain-containing protein n=1 Tax=Chara braunii TaxID=69332 RepID=A0A388KZH1_CHABU|nr:hypothetical protein CBR_g20086 [Chara braunii]|eukprot:GBG75455.1 hypothetical protein CBR_g20086 [Chara braunii]